jgi:hypothetical protein
MADPKLSEAETRYLEAVVSLGDELVRDAWPSFTLAAGESSETYIGGLAALSIVKVAYESMLKADEAMSRSGVPPIPPAFLLATIDKVVRAMLRPLIDRVPKDEHQAIFDGVYPRIRP